MRTIDTNGLVVISHHDTGERIEFYPGLFCNREITRVNLTEKGMDFLNNLHMQYLDDEISADDFIEVIRETAKEIDSVYHDLIEDKFFEKLGAN